MIRVFQAVFFLLFFVPGIVLAQNITSCSGNTGGVNFVGSISGYAQPVNCTAGDFRVLNYRRISVNAGNPTDGRGQWKTTINVQPLGGNVTPANMLGGAGDGFLFTNGANCGLAGVNARRWAFGVLGQGAVDAVNGSSYFTVGGNDMGLDMSTPGYYTLTLQDAGCVNANYYVGKTTNNPVLITHSGAAQRVVNNDGSVTVSFTLSANPSLEENFYIRYRGNTNDFSTGTTLEQASIVGTTGSVTIPVQVGSSSVNYYIFSSTRSLAQLNAHTESDRSLATLNYSDNSGANFSYASAILVNGTTPPTSALYPTFTAASGAFSAINTGIHQGVVTCIVLGDVTTENGTIDLLQSGGASNYSSITINPSGSRLVQGSVTTEMIDLNGADFVTIDGLNTGGNSLIIDNTNNTATNGTIRFVNDARNNSIRNCTLKGSSTALNAGVIFFSLASATNLGNDNNIIENNIIRESSTGDARWGIVSFGSNGAPATRLNSANTVNNNQFINCFYPGAVSGTDVSGCIHLTNAGNDSWTISNNHMYWTNIKATLSGFDYWYGIRITGGNGTGFNITGNFIGGTAPNCGGSAMGFASTANGNKLVGMQLLVSSIVASANVQGNTISNILLNTNSSKSATPYLFAGINVEAGNVVIGTTTSNIIGSSGSTGSIVVNVASNAGGVVAGIASSAAGVVSTISNNRIGGITLTNPSSSNVRVNFYGIYVNGGISSISGNTIGSTSIANSVSNQTGNTAVIQSASAGIYQTNLPGNSLTITGNTIANIQHSSNNSLAQVIGVWTNAYSNTITANSIYNLTSASPNVAVGSSSSVIGILTQGVSSTGDSISRNVIYNLQNTNGIAGAVSVTGILSGAASGAGSHQIHRNLIYDLRLSAGGNTSNIDLIRITQGNVVVANNMLCAGTAVVNNPLISGINIQGGTPLIYFNSIAITGTAAGAASSTYCVRMISGNSGTQLINNILYNNRNTTAPATNACLFTASIAQFNNLTVSNYNNFYVANGAQIGAIGAANYATLVAWQGTGKDANSVSFFPVFANVVNDLHITSGCELAKRGTTLSITVDFDGQPRSNPPDLGADEFTGTVTSVTWTGLVNTNWHVPANWCPAVVPTSTIDAIIPNVAVPNQPLIDLGGNAVCKNLTIGIGKTLTMASSRLLQVHGALFTNNGTFNAGGVSETVEFINVATINGTSATTFNNCIINNTTTLVAGVRPTMVGIFTINFGSSVNIPPNYGASSRLNYNATGTYSVGPEWTGSAVTAGVGNPNDVSISNNTTLNMPNVARGLAGTMYITSGTLQMNGTANADLYVGRDWQRTGVTGIFNPNNRAVWFKGNADQIIRVMGNGTEVFDYIVIDKPFAGTYLKPSNAAGELTNVTIRATSGDVFQIINNGSLDINGRTFTLDGNNAIAPTGFIYVNGIRTIINSDPGGINAGSFSITGTNNVNQPAYFTRSVRNNSGTGTLTFNQNVLVTLADGQMDFGFDGLTNITTVQGVLQINLGGSVFPNSCFYSGPVPASALRFANAVDYQVNATDKTWAAGAIYSGVAGIPWNVEVLNTNTDLTINDVRALRNNLTITDGRFILLSGPFTLGGNWTRTNPAGITVPPCAFVPNNNRVIFDKTGVGDQVITCTVNSNTETFYQLEISPATVNVQQAIGTDVTVENELILTNGNVDLNSNMLTLGTIGLSGILTGGSAASYIIGYKAAVNGIFKRFVPSTGSYLFPLGDLLNYTPYSLNLVSGTFTNSFINSSLYDLPHPNLGTATTYISRYWKIEPTGIASPVFNTTYTYEDGDVVGTESSLFPFRYLTAWMGSGGSGAAFIQGAGSVNTGTNVLTWNNMTSFGDFTGLGNGSPLPIALLNFEASLKENDGIINWVTGSEENNDYFTLERSWDSKIFEVINIQKGAGNSSVPLSYGYKDIGICLSGNPVAYYRLKQTDFNGSSTYSKTIALPLKVAESVMVLGYYPNPFENQFEVVLYADNNYDAGLRLYNQHGGLVFNNNTYLYKGENKVVIDRLDKLSRGVYTLRIISSGFVKHIKLNKQ